MRREGERDFRRQLLDRFLRARLGKPEPADDDRDAGAARAGPRPRIDVHRAPAIGGTDRQRPRFRLFQKRPVGQVRDPQILSDGGGIANHDDVFGVTRVGRELDDGGTGCPGGGGGFGRRRFRLLERDGLSVARIGGNGSDFDRRRAERIRLQGDIAAGRDDCRREGEAADPGRAREAPAACGFPTPVLPEGTFEFLGHGRK